MPIITSSARHAYPPDRICNLLWKTGLEGKLLREIDMWFDRELNRGGR